MTISNINFDGKINDIKGLNDAKKNGALILENKKVIQVLRNTNYWTIKLSDNNVLYSKILVNASGPWINHVLNNIINLNSKKYLLYLGVVEKEIDLKEKLWV